MAIASPRAVSAPRDNRGRQSNGNYPNNHGTKGPKPEPKIIFQTFFKSVGPRTYASQVKELSNGNHLMVLTEGKRDDTNGEIRKIRLFIFAEDFPAFFEMMKSSADFIKSHPLPESVRKKRNKFWAKKDAENKTAGGAPNPHGGRV